MTLADRQHGHQSNHTQRYDAVDAPDAQHHGFDIRQVDRKCEGPRHQRQHPRVCFPESKHAEQQISGDANDRHGNSMKHGVRAVIHDAAVQRSLMLQGEMSVR